jgi:phenylpropionate dioxygenase-like ring-hydroxylating dioxygenase large terminal subunit
MPDGVSSLAFTVDPDVTLARTLSSAFYLDPAVHLLTRERVFARSWQWLGDLRDVDAPGSLSPREMLPGHLDEPILLARDASGELPCLSNVCTHAATSSCASAAGPSRSVAATTRGVDLAGLMTFMPGFENAQNFPGPSDHLPSVPFGRFAGQAFAALAPAAPFDAFFAAIGRGLAWLPLGELGYVLDAERLGSGAGAALDEVEREDEAAVESVQRGLRSRLYRGGRYSPSHERGVHHFHRLLCEFLQAARSSSGP